MALRKGASNEVPKGAVRLTEQEAIAFQFEAARNWKPQSEMWPLLYGSFALGATTTLSGVVINDCFRKSCHLPKSSLFLIGMPIIAASGIMSCVLHHKLITEDIMLMNTSCMPCLQSRTALLMGFFGSVYPVLMCSVGNILQAERMNTMYVPSLSTEPRKFLTTCKSMIQKNGSLFTKLFVLNVVVAVVAAHFQQEAFFKLHQAR